MAEWKEYKRNDKVFFFNTATKKSQWTKPEEMIEYEKTKEETKEHAIWAIRKDRFGRTTYFNKETNDSTMAKPYDLWSEEEKAKKREEDALIIKAAEEKARLEREAKKRKKGPKMVAWLAEFKKIQTPGAKVPALVEKLTKGQELVLPCPGMVFGSVLAQFTSRKEVKDYEARRVSAPPVVPIEGPSLLRALLSATLGVAQHHPSTPKTFLPTKILHIVARYCVQDFFLFDNFLTIPTNPSHPRYPRWYGDNKFLGDDMKSIGWDERCVQLQPYLDIHKARQEEMEKEDAIKEPRCSDEAWTKFWTDKFKYKEEMNLLKRRKKLGF
eukprot:gb/GEZN01009701.1/.p1 GENE.gb/GEZN01009701.1/~~gb/GEZN01009701.1/.p1  ORF type:complete len:326 (-),score=68.92 gb/GEZN01009701.1/:290-1267(-)